MCTSQVFQLLKAFGGRLFLTIPLYQSRSVRPMIQGPTRRFSARKIMGEDAKIARDWARRFELRKLERDDVDLDFARSSGPGG